MVHILCVKLPHTSDQKGFQCHKSHVVQLATLVECSNELSAHSPVQHPDVALGRKCADNSLRLAFSL